MLTSDFILSDGVRYEKGLLVDFPLERTIAIGAPVDEDGYKQLNKMYFINLTSLGRSLISNVPYRIDVLGRSFGSILAKLLCQLLGRGFIQVLFFASVFGVLSGNLWTMFVALLVCEVAATFCFHEALHLYFFRRYANCMGGSVVVKGFHFFSLFPQRPLKPLYRLIIAGAPSMLAALIGFLLAILQIHPFFLFR